MLHATLISKKMHQATTIADRLRWLRESKQLTLRQFSERVGCDPSYLSRLETGNASNPSERFLVSIVSAFRVDVRWLRSGQGEPFGALASDSRTQEALAQWTPERLAKVMNVLDDLPQALATNDVLGEFFHDKSLEQLQAMFHRMSERCYPNLPATARFFWNDVFMLLQIEKRGRFGGQRKLLPNVSVSAKSSFVKSQMANLLARLQSATKERGKKSELAAYLKVPLASVSQWLSAEREPGGETTLKLLHWVEQQERK